MTNIPSFLSTFLCRAVRPLASSVAVVPLLVACGGGGGGDSPSPTPTPVAAVTSASAGSPVYGQTLLLTVNGSNLDLPLTVTSAGCPSPTRSTTAPNISTATTAYYTCTVAGYGAQQFSIAQTGSSTALATASYTVPAPQVSASTATATGFGQSVLLTLTGTGLDVPLTVTSTGCTGVTRSTTAPNISTATTAYYTCTASGYGSQQFAVSRQGDNQALGSATYVVPAQITAATTASPMFGQNLLLTLNGAGLDMPLTVSSPGCSSISRSTTAPNISTANTAFYNCSVASYGAQQFTITQTGIAAPLRTAAYTVPAPQIATASSSAAGLGQPMLLTLTGAALDSPMTVSSPGCTGITRSTTSPNISTATTAYYTCTAAVLGPQQFSVTRAGDNLSLSTASYTVTQPLVSTATAGAPRYSQQLVLTLTGSNLDQPLTVTSTGCGTISRSTTAPNISTPTTAYFTCTVNAVGAQQFSVVRTADSASLATAAYTVPVPQVTMAISNGAAVSGNIVITLTPQQTPVTVANFLNYVNSGFYNNSVFHRRVTNFVLQGGGYDTPVVANRVPTHKETNAEIVLEDNVGLSNTRFTVAMARRSNPDVNSASSEFFINLVDNLFLNGTASARGYAVFGTVTTGTDVVIAMSTAPCTTPNLISECLPIPNLVITSATQTR